MDRLFESATSQTVDRSVRTARSSERLPSFLSAQMGYFSGGHAIDGFQEAKATGVSADRHTISESFASILPPCVFGRTRAVLPAPFRDFRRAIYGQSRYRDRDWLRDTHGAVEGNARGSRDSSFGSIPGTSRGLRRNAPCLRRDGVPYGERKILPAGLSGGTSPSRISAGYEGARMIENKQGRSASSTATKLVILA